MQNVSSGRGFRIDLPSEKGIDTNKRMEIKEEKSAWQMGGRYPYRSRDLNLTTPLQLANAFSAFAMAVLCGGRI